MYAKQKFSQTHNWNESDLFRGVEATNVCNDQIKTTQRVLMKQHGVGEKDITYEMERLEPLADFDEKDELRKREMEECIYIVYYLHYVEEVIENEVITARIPRKRQLMKYKMKIPPHIREAVKSKAKASEPMFTPESNRPTKTAQSGASGASMQKKSVTARRPSAAKVTAPGAVSQPVVTPTADVLTLRPLTKKPLKP